MKSRMKNVAMVMPDALQALLAFGKTAENGSVPVTTIQLVQLRASQINGCSVCVDMHYQFLKQAGETPERCVTVSAWRDTPYFSEAERAALIEGILRYGREIAFAAANSYAAAAEARGAWDARLEALVVDGIVRGDAEESVLSRATALGWEPSAAATVLVGNPPSEDPPTVVFEVRSRAARAISQNRHGCVRDTSQFSGYGPSGGKGPKAPGETNRETVGPAVG